MSDDPYKYFRVEARELIEQLGAGVIDLERERPGSEIVPRLLRLAHTLKGAARVVKQREIADVAHGIEDHLEAFREAPGSVPRDRLEAVLKLLDVAFARVAAITPAPVVADSPPIRAAAEETFRTLRTDVAEIDALLEGMAETQASLVSLRRSLASVEEAGRLTGLLAADPSAPWNRDGQGPAARTFERTQITDDLRAVVGRLGRELRGGLDHLDRELQQVRDAAERLRLLPAATIFGPLDRTLRDAAREVGKSAVFRAEGGDIRLDGHVLGALQTALVQVVRNAVAHGIEPASERAAAGKAHEGTVTLRITRRRGRVAFTCGDDGGGIDVDAVRNALLRKGLLLPEGRASDPQHLLGLLLEGGISTSDTVTEVSGRGIGLDIVRDVVARLGGEVRFDTRPREGATVEIVVPVSLSSLDALVVRAAGATAAIPLDVVRHTLRVPAAEIARHAGVESIPYDGAFIPFVLLSHALKAGESDRQARGAWSAVVVSSPAGPVAIGVDTLLGTANLLVRPLPGLTPAGGVAGSTSLDAEGNPLLVLDTASLVAAAHSAARAVPAPRTPSAPILVVDDSLTTRMLEQSILESAGYTVELATSGEEALQKVARQEYALLLVDVEMPGMDGFAVLEQLQAAPERRGIPAILVTSRSSVDDRRRGAQLGAQGYMVKSEFDQAELLKRIRDLVG